MTPLTHIAFIPVKAASERVPGKNWRQIGPSAHPLWWHTAEAARRVGFFDRIVLVTDWVAAPGWAKAISDVGLLLIAEQPPTGQGAALAVVKALDELELDGPDQICWMLQATSPLRDAQEILTMKGAYEKLDPAQESLVTVTGIEARTLRRIGVQGRLRRPGGRDPCGWTVSNGAAQVASAAFLRRHRGYHAPDWTHGWDIGPIAGLDIDTEEEWQMADALLRYRDGGDRPTQGFQVGQAVVEVAGNRIKEDPTDDQPLRVL